MSDWIPTRRCGVHTVDAFPWLAWKGGLLSGIRICELSAGGSTINPSPTNEPANALSLKRDLSSTAADA